MSIWNLLFPNVREPETGDVYRSSCDYFGEYTVKVYNKGTGSIGLVNQHGGSIGLVNQHGGSMHWHSIEEFSKNYNIVRRKNLAKSVI